MSNSHPDARRISLLATLRQGTREQAKRSRRIAWTAVRLSWPDVETQFEQGIHQMPEKGKPAKTRDPNHLVVTADPGEDRATSLNGPDLS